MASKIATNFNYNGPLFLDQRQGQASSLEDLKNWSDLIPKGFKVVVGTKWYVYDPSRTPSPTTGQFFPVISDTFTGVEDDQTLSQKAVKKVVDDIEEDIQGVRDEIQDVIDSMWPLEFASLSGGGNYQKGQSVTPIISWTLIKKGETVLPTSATVDGKQTGISSDQKIYTSPSAISADKTYAVKVYSGRNFVEGTVTYRFAYPRYWGVSSLTTMTSAGVQGLSNGGSDFGTNNKLSARNFNCTGGKYPWFCIPSDIYAKSSLECWIGGLQVTDLVISTVSVTNAYNSTTNYTCIRLGQIQTGNLNIEFK